MTLIVCLSLLRLRRRWRLEESHVAAPAGMLYDAADPLVGSRTAHLHRPVVELRTVHVALKQLRQSITISGRAHFPRREVHAHQHAVKRKL